MDALKILSAFAVVIVHSVPMYNDMSNPEWKFSLIINAFGRFGVPCFIIMSSINIFKHDTSFLTVVKNRLPRLIVPLLFWSIIYILFNMFILKNTEHSLLYEVLTIPFKHKSSHLWYSYFLVELVCFSPLIAAFFRQFDIKLMALVVTFFLIVRGILDTAAILSNKDLPEIVNIGWNRLGTAEIAFVVLAIFIFDYYSKNKIYMKLVLPTLTASYFCIVGFSWYMSKVTGSPSHIFFGHLKLPDVIFGVSMFLLFFCFKDYFEKTSSKTKSLISVIASLTMGVYFIHPIVSHFISKVVYYFGYGDYFATILGTILYIFANFFVSLFVCLIISKIPFIDRIVK